MYFLSLIFPFSDTDLIKLVAIVATQSDNDEEYIPLPAAKKAAAKIPPPVRVKAQKSKKNPIPVKTAIAMNTKPKRLNGNNVRMSDLPEFADEKWRGTFLPTLYDNVFASDKPFDAFYVGSNEFVALLQSVIEEVYPDVEYKVTSSDNCCLLPETK